MRRLPHLPIAVALAATLTACGHNPGPPSPAKVEATLTRLGVNPDTVYFQPFVATSPTTGQLSRQMIAIVPSTDGTTIHIVDSQGDVFNNYNDFLSNNTLPDQPGH